MQLGYSKKLIENILEDIFDIILQSFKEKGKVKYLILALLFYEIKSRE